jgi:hypothetical protein
MYCWKRSKTIQQRRGLTDIDHRFLYTLFLALDANFCMRRKDVSSEASDPDLGNSLAFFGEVNSYMAHLEKHWDQPQPVGDLITTRRVVY